MSKKILTINSSLVNSYPQNTLITGYSAVQIYNLVKRRPVWKERASVEDNEAYRQIIPYVMVEHEDSGEIVLMIRGRQTGEARLHDKYYIGVGGHIEIESAVSGDPVLATISKELYEELGFSLANSTLLFQGVILKDEEAVDRVHLGLFFHLITNERIFSGDELEWHCPEWCDREVILDKISRLEGWSEIVVGNYFEIA